MRHRNVTHIEQELRALWPAGGVTIGGQWHASTDLINDPQLRARLVHDHATFRSIDTPRFAASLFFQRYCHRLSSVAVGAWVLTQTAADMAPENVTFCVRDASPVSLQLSGRTRDCDTATEAISGLVDEHLLPLARHISAEYRLSLGNLWGNMAASIGQAARALSTRVDAATVLDLVTPLIQVHPMLVRTGSFRILTGSNGPRLFYDRASCCHWHEIPDGKLCSYCCLLSHEERTERFAAAMAAE